MTEDAMHPTRQSHFHNILSFLRAGERGEVISPAIIL
jgi:hypothetical protein